MSAAISTPHPIATTRRGSSAISGALRVICGPARLARRSSSIWAIVPAIVLLGAPVIARAQTVDAVVASHSGGCTTAGVEGISEQLVRTHLCMFPGTVTTFAPYPNISIGSRVHALSAVETRDALHRAADRGSLQVSSAFRTLVEQYLLYNEGGCGLAARPGASNHQSGVAVDLSNYSAALTRMTGAGCRHPYPGDDPVHFDCPGPDMRAASITVFQHLWNANNPGDRIAEDGAYGPQTAARVGRSPAGGFASDGCMVAPPRQWGAAFVAQSFPTASAPPIVLHPGEELTGFIEMRNVGTETWDGNTRLGTTGPRDRASMLAGGDWSSPSRAAAVSGTVARDGTWRFAFTLRAPDALGDYREHFGIVQEGVTWFGDPGQLGPPDAQLELSVSVVAAEPMLDAGMIAEGDAGVPLDVDASELFADASELDRDGGAPRGPGSGIEGSCSCRAAGAGRGGASGALMMLLVAVAVFARRRAR